MLKVRDEVTPQFLQAGINPVKTVPHFLTQIGNFCLVVGDSLLQLGLVIRDGYLQIGDGYLQSSKFSEKLAQSEHPTEHQYADGYHKSKRTHDGKDQRRVDNEGRCRFHDILFSVGQCRDQSPSPVSTARCSQNTG